MLRRVVWFSAFLWGVTQLSPVGAAEPETFGSSQAMGDTAGAALSASALAELLVERGSQLAVHLLRRLAEARNEGDILLVSCIDDKLTQVNAHVATLARYARELSTAQAMDDSARSERLATMIRGVSKELEKVEGEAQMCLGEDAFQTEGTVIMVTPSQDGRGRAGPPVMVPPEPVNVGVIPPALSPVL